MSPLQNKDNEISELQPKMDLEEKKVHDKNNEAKASAALFTNRLGQAIILIIMIIFNVVFWHVAITEYTRPIEYYIN